MSSCKLSRNRSQHVVFLTSIGACKIIREVATVVELVDTLDLGSSVERRGGSSPSRRISSRHRAAHMLRSSLPAKSPNHQITKSTESQILSDSANSGSQNSPNRDSAQAPLLFFKNFFKVSKRLLQKVDEIPWQTSDILNMAGLEGRFLKVRDQPY